MAKGQGSTRVRLFCADLLEGRLLLSHVTSLKSVHTSTGTTAQVAPITATRPEVTPSRSTSTPDEAETRESEQNEVVATVVSISSIMPQKSAVGIDEITSTLGPVFSPLYLRTVNRDELIAWGLRAGGVSNFVASGRHLAHETLTVPDSASQVVDALATNSQPAPGPEIAETEVLPTPQGSDLLAHFLPADCESVDRAIVQILDGFEGLGSEISLGVEATGGTYPTILWSVSGIIAIELIRRRLQRLKSSANSTDDRDLAIGLPLGFPA